MYLEIYADSLLILHFFMNLYMLSLVNCMLYHAITCKRLIAGAGLGAVSALLPVFLPLNLVYGEAIGFLLSVSVMCGVVFKVNGIKQFLGVLEKMFLATLLIGAIVMLFIRLLPEPCQFAGTLMVLIAGGIGTLLISRMVGGKKMKNTECIVILKEGEKESRIKGLMDTGNTLVEPISKRPVAIMEEKIMLRVLGGTIPEGCRMIPFRSVGKEHGMLKGYHLKQLLLETEGVRKVCSNIYVAASEELVSREGESMVILSPMMLKKEGKV